MLCFSRVNPLGDQVGGAASAQWADVSQNSRIPQTLFKKTIKGDVQHWGFSHLKQPALPGKAPQTKKTPKKILKNSKKKKSQLNEK
jgi:hypothetical protein